MDCWAALATTAPSPRKEVIHEAHPHGTGTDDGNGQALRVGDFKVVFEKGPMWSSLESRPAAQGGSGPKNASGLNDWWAAPHSSDTSEGTDLLYLCGADQVVPVRLQPRAVQARRHLRPTAVVRRRRLLPPGESTLPLQWYLPPLFFRSSFSEAKLESLSARGSQRPLHAVVKDPCEYHDLSKTMPAMLQQLVTRLADYQVRFNSILIRFNSTLIRH